MDGECVFCKIVSGQLTSNIQKETPDFLVIHDIAPKAPTHLLIVPKKHVSDILAADESLWVGIHNLIKELSVEYGLSGFRITTNIGDAAAISHLHVHFLAGIDKDRHI